MNRFFLPLFFLVLSGSFMALSMPLTPLSASLGNAGRSGYQAAEFHILNPATILHGDVYQLSSFYSYTSDTSDQIAYGLSMTNTKNIPLGITWIKQGQYHISVFSIAGKLSPQMFIGASIHRSSKNENLIPQVGLIYQPFKKLTLSVTGTRVHQILSYGLGSRFMYSPNFVIYADVLYEKKDFLFQGGLEFITKNAFSLRLGSVWPHPVLNIGVSFNAYPIKMDYTWMQNKAHIFGIRIQS